MFASDFPRMLMDFIHLWPLVLIILSKHAIVIAIKLINILKDRKRNF